MNPSDFPSLLASQAPTPVAPPGVDWVTSLIDRGPWGLVIILMVALFWLFRYEESKIEKWRGDAETKWDEIRNDNKELLVRATEAVTQNNQLLDRVASRLDKE